MTHKLKTEIFSQKIEYSGGVFLWPLTPLFSFVSFHLKHRYNNITGFIKNLFIIQANINIMSEKQELLNFSPCVFTKYAINVFPKWEHEI